MITCETCGQILPDGTVFCSNCGAPISHSAATPKPDEAAPIVPDSVGAEAQPFSSASGDGYAEPQQTTGAVSPQPVQQPVQNVQPSQPEPEPYNPYVMPPQQTPPQNGYYSSAPNPAPQQSYTAPQQGYGAPQYDRAPSYQQPYGSQLGNPYAQQGYYAQPPKQTDGKAVVSLIMGILSLFASCFYGAGIVFGIIGIVFGVMSKREMASKGTSEGSGMATGGCVCSIIGTAISVLYLLILIFALIFGFASTYTEFYY